MLIQKKCTDLLQSVRSLQKMVQEGEYSSLEKLKSQKLLETCEDSIKAIFDLPEAEKQEVANVPLNITAASIALDIQHADKLFKAYRGNPKYDLQFMRYRADRALAYNTFTKQPCHVLAELGNDKEMFYIVVYPNGYYTIAAEKTIRIHA